MQWDELVEKEPLLRDVYDCARTLKATSNVCLMTLWYNVLKPHVNRSVGWNRPAPRKFGILSLGEIMQGKHEQTRQPTATEKVLYTSEAYDLAYQTIYDAMPRCRCTACKPAR